MEEHPTQKPRPRIESLADLVFGLALSIGAIILVGNPPATPSALENDIITFAFNFIILISVWLNYTSVTSVLPLENRRTLVLNVAMLFAVSIEPFLFNLLRVSPSPASPSFQLFVTTSALYGLDICGMMAILGIFSLTLADEEKKLVPRDMLRKVKLQATNFLISSGFFLVSALPIFDELSVAHTYVRTDLWWGALVVAWARRSFFSLGKRRNS